MNHSKIVTNTLVVGAGQAGIAMSEHLGALRIPHVVLERDRVAEHWRSWRWDSLVANGPAWHDRFPGLAFDDHDPDSFVPKEKVANYFEEYARRINAPIQTGVEVVKLTRHTGGSPRFVVETSAGIVEAENVVAATGAFQQPVIPAVVPPMAGVAQMHSVEYRNPRQLAEGAVLVVGAGSSGAQIADELQRAGRRVFLSVSGHDRPPRFYRGRDYDWWLGVLGLWDVQASPEAKHLALAVSGVDGGRTVDFRRLAHEGVTLVGTVQSGQGGVVHFADDLRHNIQKGDENYLGLLRAADAYIENNGLDLPVEETAYDLPDDPDCLITPLSSIDLARERVTTIIWATGFRPNFNWISLDIFEKNGFPRHQRGVSEVDGLYFLGLPWLTCRGSSFIWGVWHDAKSIAGHIANREKYREFHLAALVRKPEGVHPAQELLPA